MLSSKEGIEVLGKVFSEAVTLELRLGWFKTKGMCKGPGAGTSLASWEH